MARKTQPPQRHPAELTPEQAKTAVSRIQKRIDDLQALDPTKLLVRGSPQVVALRASIEGTLADVFGHESLEYHRYKEAASLYEGAIGPLIIGGHQPHVPDFDFREPLEKSKQRSIALLKQAVEAINERFSELDENALISDATGTPALDLSQSIFIVHGRDEAVRESVARFLEKMGFTAVILHEQPNKGRALITKFDEVAEGIGFAVVLMTPDDVGGAAGGDLRPRARQNVIFELGYFIGALGPARVAAITQGDLELPSDYEGVVYIPWDGDWRTALARELQAAAYEIDWNKVMR
jgi:predicted nucleotide-binding protein